MSRRNLWHPGGAIPVPVDDTVVLHYVWYYGRLAKR